MKLVIAEKPSVARAIAAVLGATKKEKGFLSGGGWLVSWCVGHLVELAPAGAYDEKYTKWRREDLPILPDRWQYTVPKDKAGQLGVLRGLMKRGDVKGLVCATDAGREGELIFRLAYEHYGCKKPVERLWISSMEESAIAAGFAALRPGAEYDRLYAAALCRAQADWLVGINATRLFSCLYGATLNVGRVQTPTLALMIRREVEIETFVPEAFFTPEISTGGFTATSERLSDAAAAEAVRSACAGAPASVAAVEKQEKTAAPPRLYDLTTLQRESNRLFGYTAQQTLDYTQALYEKRLVTYPRTDSQYLTDDMRVPTGSLVNWLCLHLPFAKGTAFTPDMGRVIDSGKVSDHHAIIPTMDIAKADTAALPAGEQEVLRLVAARLICATAPPHSYEAVTATLACAGHTFTAKGKTILRDGWKAIDTAFKATLKRQPDATDTAEQPEEGRLPELVEGAMFDAVITSVREGRTTPLRRYTEDTLLAAMETAGQRDAAPDANSAGTYEAECFGLGTPATRAAIIEKLVKSGAITRQKKNLIPTEKGLNLIAVLPDEIKSPLLTAEWEHKLAQVERGTLEDSAFMDGIVAMTHALVSGHTAPLEQLRALFAAQEQGKEISKCPRCGAGVAEGRKGFFCTDRACGFALWKDNRFFAAKRKPLDKKTAAALIRDGRVFLPGLYSEKSGKTYDATVVLEDTGKYIHFKLLFDKGVNK